MQMGQQIYGWHVRQLSAREPAELGREGGLNHFKKLHPI